MQLKFVTFFINKGLKVGQVNTPLIFNDIACDGLSSTLFQCVDLNSIGVYDCDVNNNTVAGVICTEKTSSDSVSKNLSLVC